MAITHLQACQKNSQKVLIDILIDISNYTLRPFSKRGLVF